MKAAKSLELIYKAHLGDGHKEAKKMVAIVLANVIDDIDLNGGIVTAEAIEDGLFEKAMIHSGGFSNDEVA